MYALSTVKFNHSSVVQFRTLQPAAAVTKFQRPEECLTSTVLSLRSCSWLWLNNDQVRFKQTCNVIQNRAAGLEEFGKDDSTVVGAGEVVNKIENYIFHVRERLSTIGNGRISVSPYDTAWVALIKDINGQDDRPQFPSSLEWIAQNQLPDGSWGDEQFFIASDRLVNTLACVVALRSWNLHPNMSEKGISFIKENVYQLENENAEHTICGFEVVFPALLQRAQKLGIDDIPYDAPVVREIYSARDKKLKRIPKELVHTVPTSFLFSLEGFENLDWEKLLKLQAKNGSFLTSPSSTAYAFMESKDVKCFKFINNIVQEFNGGAPHSYPADIFARLWAVDRLQRLGISRFFESEINDCLNHVHRFWSDVTGVFSARDVGFSDIDDTSMGFRLLRLQGYEVNPNVFKHFQMGNKFSCYAGQMIESPSPIYSLYRASQLLFPGEKILEEAMDFSYQFLKERLMSGNPLLDKWVISKNLPNEIQNGLDIPWYASLPRLEARLYIEHYGGANEIWNGKTWNRMYDISNNEYLELAKLDFNRCQEQHQMEWTFIQEWYNTYNIEKFGISRKYLLLAYFLATASLFEPEKSKERVAWAKSQIISKMIASFFNKETTSHDQQVALLSGFMKNTNGLGSTNRNREQGLVTIMLDALHQFLEGLEGNIRHPLKGVWHEWLTKLHQGMTNAQEDGELQATILNICSGYVPKEEILSHPEYKILAKLTYKICRRFCESERTKVDGMEYQSIKDQDIEQDMQELVQLVLDKSGGIERKIKHTFLTVARTYYYRAYTAAEKIKIHISKVLFEPVL